MNKGGLLLLRHRSCSEGTRCRSALAPEIVAAVLDHRSAGVAHQLLDRVLAAQPVAPEDLQGALRT